MSIASLLTDLEKLCYDLQDWNGDPSADNIRSRIKEVHKKAILESTWIQKNAHHRTPVCVFLNNALNADPILGANGPINEAQGRVEQAVKIDKAEREKGIPKPFKQEGNIEDNGLEFLDDAINLEQWLEWFGEGVVGPSWWMDNPDKKPSEWDPRELPLLNKRLTQSEDGKLLNDKTHVFRYLGKGFQDRGEWVAAPDGVDYLFAVFSLDNDPGRISKSNTPEPVFDIDIERWLDVYGEEEHPARMMCTVENQRDKINLQKKLIDLDGTLIRDTHVWRDVGQKTYKREGKKHLFKCEPV